MSDEFYNDNDEPVTISLWFVRETEKARLYSKTPPGREPDTVWVPKSIIEHTTKWPDGRHEVKLPGWFVEREAL